MKFLLSNFKHFIKRSSLLFVCVLVSFQMTFGQSTIGVMKDSTSGVGGELIGSYVLGGTLFTAGAGFAILGIGFEGGHGKVFSPIVTGGVVAAPASLVGLGIGTLLAKKHSKISRSFQIGMGVTYSPIFIHEQNYVAGIDVKILSPEIGKWRYNFGFNYFSKKYILFDSTTRNSWAAINLDLQYLFSIGDSFRIYPFVGTQINDSTKKEIYTNMGAGINYHFGNKWGVYGEFKLSLDPDMEPIRAVYSLGALYYLK